MSYPWGATRVASPWGFALSSCGRRIGEIEGHRLPSFAVRSDFGFRTLFEFRASGLGISARRSCEPRLVSAYSLLSTHCSLVRRYCERSDTASSAPPGFRASDSSICLARRHALFSRSAGALDLSRRRTIIELP